MRKSFFFLLFCAAVSKLSIAQDSLQSTTLREIVVSATRTEQPVIEIPRSVTIISEETIRSSVYQSLGDLLNAQSGVYIVGANQTPGTNQNIFMRGANSNQVAVLIDGVRVTDPSSPNAAVDLSEISLANVERVEVIRGAHSTMFGGAAIGGVINVITKKNPDKGFHGNVSWQGGTFGGNAGASTETAQLEYGMKSGVYVNGAVFRQDVRGLDATAENADNQSFTSDHDDFRKTDASLKTGFRNDAWDANISFRRSHQYAEVDNGAFSDDDNYYLTFDRNLVSYYVRHDINPALSFSLLGSFSDSERFYENDSSQLSSGVWDKAFASGTYSGWLQTHEAQVNYNAAQLEVVAGAGVYGEKMSFDNYFFYNDPQFPLEVRTDYDSIDARTTTRYLFARAGYGWERFKVSAGARLSHHSLAGALVNLEVNPSFTSGDILVYASLSSAYNAPSLYQLYDPTKNYGAYTTRGNAGLKPERALSIEAGVKKELGSGSYLTLSAYRTQVTGSIEYVYLWERSTSVDALTFADDRGDTYINAGEQRAVGVELEGNARISNRFSLHANLTYLNTDVKAGPQHFDLKKTGGHHIQLYNLGSFLKDGVSQERLVRRPDFISFVRLTYRPVERVTLGVGHRYTGKRFDSGFDGTLGPYGGLGRIEVQAYHLIDATVNWRATKSLTLSCQVDNLLDEDYREVVGFQTRGRSAHLKVSARW